MIERWVLWMTAQGLSQRTITERVSTMRTLFAFAGVDGLDLEPRNIQQFMARRISAATRATYHATIRAFCTWAQRTGERPDNPADQTPRPKRPKSKPRPISDGQLSALLGAANRRRTRTYVLLGALAGLRVHEIAKVHGDDIDHFMNALTVVGKGGQSAVIPLHDVLVKEAANYPRHGYWFPSYTAGEHVSSHAVSQAIAGAMLRAGFNGKPHQLRHFYGTELVRGGVHLRVVQELMRHRSPASTAIYTDVQYDQLRDGIGALQLKGLAA